MPRVFSYGALQLPDPAPALSPEDVLSQIFALQYPELHGAQLSGPTLLAGNLAFKIETGFKAKG